MNSTHKPGLDTINLYDLAGEDHYLIARKVKWQAETFGTIKQGIRIEVMNENDHVIATETIHPYAWESLVAVAKQIISQESLMNEVS